MKLGFGIPVSGSWATPANIVEISRAAERLGYDSLWSFQRTIYPYDDSIPVPYRSVHDPLAISAYVAGVTERVRIGIAIVNRHIYSPIIFAVRRHSANLLFSAPIMLGKTLTSIDLPSDGRLDAGLGLGWNADEFAAAGVPMERRGARADDFIACLRAIWTQDPVEHHGEFYDVPRGYVDPKPAQRPPPPILLGGSAEPALKRAGRIADGWISASRFEAARVPAAVETIRTAARDAGRDPADVRVIIRGSVKVRDTDSDTPLTGTVDKIKRDMTDYADAGVTELFVDLNFDDQIGNPEADPAESMRRAHAALEAFAPGG